MNGFDDISFEIEAAVCIRTEDFPLKRIWRTCVSREDGEGGQCWPALWQADAEKLVPGYETDMRVVAFLDWPLPADDIEAAKRFAISATHAACFSD